MFPFLEIFGLNVPMFGICLMTGILLAGAVGILLCKKRGIFWEDLIVLAAIAVPVGIIGAKLLSIFTVFEPSEVWGILLSDPLSLLTQTGLVFYGGILLGVPAAVIAAKIIKTQLSDYEGIFITVVPLAHAFGRFGCFCAGCCYGKQTDQCFGVVFKDPVGGAPDGVPLIPVQLFEAAFNLVLFGILLMMILKFPRSRLILPVYLVCYGAERFLMELLRDDEIRGIYFGLSTSQWISIAVFAAGAALGLFRILKKQK